jgi:hypothetical protein
MLDCLRSRCMVPRAFRLRIHPPSKRQCAQSALRARTACRYGSGRGTPVASHACFETASIARSRSPTLADFETIGCIDQPAGRFVQTRALVGLGPRCSVVLGGQRCRCNARYAICSGKPAAQRRTLGQRLRPRAAGSKCKCGCLRSRFKPNGLSQRVDTRRRGRKGGAVGLSLSCKVGRRRSHQGCGGPASSKARSRKSPQHLCDAMRAAVQPGAAAERQQPPSAPVAAR